MSASPRRSPVLNASPRPSPLSRPHFPWTTYHRPSSSLSLAPSLNTSQSGPWDAVVNSQSALNSSSSGTVGWSPGNLPRSGIPPNMQSQTVAQENMRHWNFTALEWVVRDVHRLQQFVEVSATNPITTTSIEGTDKEAFEILRDGPILGDQKFKLEIAQTVQTDEPNSEDVQIQTLSLYITCLLLEYPSLEEIPASLMVAIKSQNDLVGERGARSTWVFQHWQTDWVFRQESEVWECTLPTLSSLLENRTIADTDSFVICVQIHSPTGPFYPQQPSGNYIPKSLLSGLEASIDNPNTGDVVFICVERQPDQPTLNSPAISAPGSVLSSLSSYGNNSVQFMARKRLLYAHSDILIHRSDYFATMLNSAFSENQGTNKPGQRRTYPIIVEEADFVTVYWLLKWVYANWLLFEEEDDPRQAVEGFGTGWSARWLGPPGALGEWDWKTIRRPSPHDFLGARESEGSPTSGGSPASSRILDPAIGKRKTPSSQASSFASSSKVTSRPTPVRTTTQNTATTTTPRRAQSTGSSAKSNNLDPIQMIVATQLPAVLVSQGNATSPTITQSLRQSTPGRAAGRSSHNPPSAIPPPDPHPHPVSQPQAASALAIYQIAHRYHLPDLAELALEHIMNTITPRSSFPLLLASALWIDLHALVEDYIIDRWDDVSASEDFDRCCQEVAAGEWGPEGGKTLVRLFRRLRSPAGNTLFNRT